MEPSRREALLLGGTAGLTALSGCSGLLSGPPKLTLELINFTDEPHTLALRLFRMDGTDRSDATVLRDRFELQSSGEETSYSESYDDAVDSDRYVVQAHLVDDRSVRADHLFYPDCAGGGGPPDKLLVEVDRNDGDSEPFFRFQQNTCASL